MSERHDNNPKVNQTGKCDPEMLFFHSKRDASDDGDNQFNHGVNDNNLENDDETSSQAPSYASPKLSPTDSLTD